MLTITSIPHDGEFAQLPLFTRRSRRPSRKKRPEEAVRQALFVTLVEEWLGRPYDEVKDALTASERGRVNRAVAELVAIGVLDPEEVRRRALHYRLHFPNAACTPQALTANWSVCADPPSDPRAGEGATGSIWDWVDGGIVERESGRLLRLLAAGRGSFSPPLDEREQEVVAFWCTLERELSAGRMIHERVRTLDLLRRWILARRERALAVPHEVELLLAFYVQQLGWRPERGGR